MEYKIKHFDPHLKEEVETREYPKYGACIICSSPNHTPKKWGLIYPCSDCFITRTEECKNIKNEFDKFTTEKE